jgi:predicted SAM-dependent methyltransferase
MRSRERPVKVHVACGHDHKDGWLNTDLYFSAWCVDALKPLPFPDHSIDYLYSQHFVEHLTRDQACAFFGECRRILRPEGILRISTPDLAWAVRDYTRAVQETQQVHRAARESAGTGVTPCRRLNEVFRSHDHLHIFDFEDLRECLLAAGFGEVQRAPDGDSEDPHLRGLETRYAALGEEAQAVDLVVEAKGILSSSPVRK